jgi:type IV pilus assembly protein PilB
MNFGVEKIDLAMLYFTPELLSCVPATTARKHRVLPIFESLDCLVIALADVNNLELIDSLRHDLHRDLEFRVADRQQLDELIQRFYGDDNK